MRDQGAEVCYSCWCFTGVCAKPATLQLYCRGGWDYHCKSSAWRKKGGRSWKTEYAGKEKTASKMLESTYLWLLLPGGTTSGKFVFMTDALQTTCRSDSLQRLIFLCWNCHTNTLLIGIQRTTDVGKKLWNLQKISMEWNYITRIYDENLSRQSMLQDTTLRTSPMISAYAVEAIKYFKNTAWTINKTSCQSADQQISWKHSKNITVLLSYCLLC